MSVEQDYISFDSEKPYHKIEIPNNQQIYLSRTDVSQKVNDSPVLVYISLNGGLY